MGAGAFAAYAVALYVAHHVGDYWVQTDTQARRKGEAGALGRLYCAQHVGTYLITQIVCLMVTCLVLGIAQHGWRLWCALAVSGVTHYVADRRRPLEWIAGWIPGKANFWRLGAPRRMSVMVTHDENVERDHVALDNPTLATGAWALDQSWHIFWGVFVAALILAS